MNISDKILQEESVDLREYTRTRLEQPNIGNLLFPSVKTEDLQIEYIIGGNKMPVTAQVYAPDTTTKLSGREGYTKNILDMLLVKDSKMLSEKELLALYNPRTSTEEKNIINKIFNDVDSTIDSVYKRINMLRFEVLQNGKITLDENGVKGTIDYHLPEEHKAELKTTKRWGETTAKPLEDLYSWVDKIVADTGIIPTRALTNRKTLSLLLNDAGIRKAIYGVNFDRMLSLKELNVFLAQMELPTIAIYDEKYRVGSETKGLINDNTFIIMPEGKLGNTHFGVTAEEIELIGKQGFDEYSQKDFITSLIYRNADPVGRITKSVARAIPSFESANEVFIAKVK